MTLAAWTAVTALLAIACWTDLRRREIPNALTATFAGGGLLYHGVVAGAQGLAYSALGAAAGMLPLLLMYLLRGIGGGDVKWFAAFGTWSGAAIAWQLVVLSILFAGGIATVLLLLRCSLGKERARRWMNRITGRASGHLRGSAAFPFMAAVAPAVALLGWQG